MLKSKYLLFYNFNCHYIFNFTCKSFFNKLTVVKFSETSINFTSFIIINYLVKFHHFTLNISSPRRSIGKKAHGVVCKETMHDCDVKTKVIIINKLYFVINLLLYISISGEVLPVVFRLCSFTYLLTYVLTYFLTN